MDYLDKGNRIGMYFMENNEWKIKQDVDALIIAKEIAMDGHRKKQAMLMMDKEIMAKKEMIQKMELMKEEMMNQKEEKKHKSDMEAITNLSTIWKK